MAQEAAVNDRSTSDAASVEILVYGRVDDTVLSIPQSVTVLDESLIETSSSETVGDALRFVPGTSRDGSPLDAFGDTYLIRGFPSNQTVNGITANPLRQARDSIAVERIEVLKGPASVLYGQLQPGAVVNIVTKQPERAWAGKAALNYGRYDDWRGTIDFTGPLTANGDVRFRVTGAYDDADSFIDYWHRQHIFVAPTLAFDVGEATTVTIEGLYTRNKLRGFLNGLPAEGTVLPNPNGRLPRSLGLTDPSFAPSIRENSEITARVEHRFSDRVRWRTTLSWTDEKTDEEGVFGLLGWDEQYQTLTRAVLSSSSKGDSWTAHTDLAFDLTTGPISHDLVVGADYRWFDRYNLSAVELAPSLDVYNPVYNLAARPDTVPVVSLSSETDERTRTAGLFAQDRITVTEQLKLVAGVRWSRYRQRTVSARGGDAASTSRQTQTAWTSQLGILYTPTANLSFFANRTTSFLPVEGVTADGSPLEPETGTQYELGARSLLLDGRLELNAALFHLKRADVAVSDRDDPSALIGIGEQVARGFELSATAEPIDGLSLYAGYAFTKAKTTDDTDAALIGKRIRNIPRHSLVLLSSYSIQAGPLAGLSVAGSATYTGDRAGDLQDSFELPSYWRADARIAYPVTEQVELSASVENLTDKRYYSHAFSQFEVWPGAPRTWRLGAAVKF